MSVKEKREHLGMLDEARVDVLTRIDQLKALRKQSTERLAELRIEGDADSPEAEELREERDRLDREAEELEAVLPKIQLKVQETRATLDEVAVDELVQRIRKTAGGLVGERPRHIERAEELEAKAAQARTKAEQAAARSTRLHDAARALQRLVGVEVGEIKHAHGPRTPVRRYLQLGQLRDAGKAALAILEGENLLTEESASAIRAAITALDEETERERFEERQQAARDEHAQERKEAQTTVDGWLKEVLQDGPVLRERVLRMAKSKSLPITRDPYQASLADARRRLKVVPVREVEDDLGRSWWALPDRFDEERFKRVGASQGAPLSAIQG